MQESAACSHELRKDKISRSKLAPLFPSRHAPVCRTSSPSPTRGRPSRWFSSLPASTGFWRAPVGACGAPACLVRRVSLSLLALLLPRLHSLQIAALLLVSSCRRNTHESCSWVANRLRLKKTFLPPRLFSSPPLIFQVLFNFKCSWEYLDHQHGDCGQFEFFRNNEWLTKAVAGHASDYPDQV